MQRIFFFSLFISIVVLECTIQNCKTCSEETGHCTECDDTYTLKYDGSECKLTTDITCLFTIQNCKTCSAEETGHCIACDDTYTLKYDGSQCKLTTDITCLFTIQNCKTCSAEETGHCIACDDTYTLKYDGSQCKLTTDITCLFTIQNCKTCSADEKSHCIACDDTYTLKYDGSQCKLTTDITCLFTIQNCKTCSADEKSHCIACDDTYTLKYDGSECKLTTDITCLFTIQNCKTCSAEETGHCIACDDTYTLKYDGSQCKLTTDITCLFTIQNCKTCSADEKSHCIACDDTYTLKYDGSECKLTTDITCLFTIQNCKTCSAEETGHCIACDDTYTLKYDGSQCKLTTDITCLFTIQNCKTCSAEETGHCIACDDTYTLKYDGSQCKLTTDIICLFTIQNCQTCSNTDPLICSLCNSEYYLTITNTCVGCPKDCLTCKNSQSCITCKPNFTLNVTTDFSTCIPATSSLACLVTTNCISCNQTDYTKCAECSQSHYLIDDSCLACLSNCASCSSGMTCNACMKNYIWSEVDNQCIVYVNQSECMNIVGCIQCNSITTTQCALCKGGSKPTIEGKCSCNTGELLISGKCITQASNADFASIDDKEINDLLGMVTLAISGDNKENNTQKVLSQLKTKLTTIDSTTGAQAISLLISLADTTTKDEAQADYKELLSSVCKKGDLDDSIYQSAFEAADKFYTSCNSADVKKQVYEAGFSSCLNSLLNKESPSDIPLMKLSHSEFQMKALQADSASTTYVFSNSIQIKVTEDVLNAIPSSASAKLYVVAKAIDGDSNPYNESQKNQVQFQSKIVSFTVMQKSSTETTALSLELKDNKTFPISFDSTGKTCGHYNITTQKWERDGNVISKICYFNHTTDFVIYSESASSINQDKESAQTIQFWSVPLLILFSVLI